jgi:predicted negative regulator of RcsB-dependent stress response
VGTTKLTRKEILAEDPIHAVMLYLIEFFRVNGAKVGVAAVAVVVLALGIYSGFQFFEGKTIQAQERFAKGMDFFHAEVKPDATDDQGKSYPPLFRSEAAKYQAAAKEFSSITSGKMAVVARYYLGLSQLELGQKKEAVQNLESVASNSKNRTLGFMAKRVLATNDFDSGNHKEAQEILSGMLKDPQCDLQKEDLSIQLSRVLVAQGKLDEAIKVLSDAKAQSPSFGMYKQQIISELAKLQKVPKASTGTKPAHP